VCTVVLDDTLTHLFSCSQDMVLCRRFRGLERQIAAHQADVKCTVKYWTGAWEVEEILGEP
jgi:pyridoxal phosphate phosphatase PHOSPHO2